MPPEEIPASDAPQAAPESPAPAVEASAPEPVPSASESTPAPTEAVPAPVSAQPVTPTAQMAGNEPLAPKSDPISPPSAAAPQAQPIPVIVPPTGNFIRNLLAKASAKIQSKKKAKLEKILQALNSKNKITNDEVEKLLHVSDATATRYLSVLEKEGKIIQVGKQGKGILYIKTP